MEEDKVRCGREKRRGKVSRRRWRGVNTHLEGKSVYMREGHCLHGSGSAENKDTCTEK